MACAAGALLTLLAWTGAHAAIGPDACDARGFQTILHPAADIAFARDAFHDLLAIRASSTLADKRATQATFDAATGEYSIPPRTAVVFVEE